MTEQETAMFLNVKAKAVEIKSNIEEFNTYFNSLLNKLNKLNASKIKESWPDSQQYVNQINTFTQNLDKFVRYFIENKQTENVNNSNISNDNKNKKSTDSDMDTGDSSDNSCDDLEDKNVGNIKNMALLSDKRRIRLPKKTLITSAPKVFEQQLRKLKLPDCDCMFLKNEFERNQQIKGSIDDEHGKLLRINININHNKYKGNINVEYKSDEMNDEYIWMDCNINLKQYNYDNYNKKILNTEPKKRIIEISKDKLSQSLPTIFEQQFSDYLDDDLCVQFKMELQKQWKQEALLREFTITPNNADYDGTATIQINDHRTKENYFTVICSINISKKQSNIKQHSNQLKKEQYNSTKEKKKRFKVSIPSFKKKQNK